MNALYTLFERLAILTFAVCLSFALVYVPHQFNQVQESEAFCATCSTWIGDAASFVVEKANSAYNYVSSAANTVTATLAESAWIKTNVLNGLGWTLAKTIIAQMTSSIVKWINSGFAGSPSFVTDLSGFLVDIVDGTVGTYMNELGGPFSFICAPFSLDVRLAVSLSLKQIADGGTAPANTCTLTGAMENLKGFIDGSQGFVEAGGWDNWFTITQNPDQYTPVGSILAAKSEGISRILNAKGQAVKELDFGKGFLSAKICQTVTTPGDDPDDDRAAQNCSIQTPGDVINQTLNFHLQSGTRSLIQADDINEVLASVFSQLAIATLNQGLAQLTQAGSGPGGGSYTEEVSASGLTSDPGRIESLITDSLDIESDLQDLALEYDELLTTFAASTPDPEKALLASEQIEFIETELQPSVEANVIELQNLRDRFTALQPIDPTDTEALQDITSDYLALRDDLHSKPQMIGYKSNWDNIMAIYVH